MSHQNFSGTWKFDPVRSSLQIPPPESTTFVIEHREPLFRLTRTHVFEGQEDTFSIELKTAGEPTVHNHRGFEIRARLYWEGEALVFDSTLTREGEQATNLVRYTLEDDGQTFVAEEHFRGNQQRYCNKWIFEKV
jgi:hypothetical protein